MKIDRTAQVPWSVGDKLIFVTFDHELTRMSELDATTATVLSVEDPENSITVKTIYGVMEDVDPFNFMKLVGE